ncbi:MarR family winged helix-turn-helix transcriptional regulator [Rhodococcus jostii]|uniref:DNA-binding transcriptional regulator, MarR family n=1 Tax=Rhodococcus jostii TaxID=132919 RepID=A0A1H5FJU8_RHOJO|nr:MarR family transcriptional regulator [Rhodococcus jostii]TQC49507.1 MarR family transcriptional regulator [Rhodococcus sp. WS4]SEE03404.1 DNA-binding transcriptional regulator, MarR family [Rhodococcus jostii]
MDEKVDRLREDVVMFNRRIRAQRAGHRLTPSQLQALAHLDREGPMSARALADLEQVAPQSIARTVSMLEDAGMVSRTVDPQDARASIVAITAPGLQTLAADRSRRNEWLSAALATECTDAERDLLFIAGRLLRRLAATPEPSPQRESLMNS